MEKQQNLANCDSMATTVTVKDYQGVDYQDPPPVRDRVMFFVYSTLIAVRKRLSLPAALSLSDI